MSERHHTRVSHGTQQKILGFAVQKFFTCKVAVIPEKMDNFSRILLVVMVTLPGNSSSYKDFDTSDEGYDNPGFARGEFDINSDHFPDSHPIPGLPNKPKHHENQEIRRVVESENLGDGDPLKVDFSRDDDNEKFRDDQSLDAPDRKVGSDFKDADGLEKEYSEIDGESADADIHLEGGHDRVNEKFVDLEKSENLDDTLQNLGDGDLLKLDYGEEQEKTWNDEIIAGGGELAGDDRLSQGSRMISGLHDNDKLQKEVTDKTHKRMSRANRRDVSEIDQTDDLVNNAREQNNSIKRHIQRDSVQDSQKSDSMQDSRESINVQDGQERSVQDSRETSVQDSQKSESMLDSLRSDNVQDSDSVHDSQENDSVRDSQESDSVQDSLESVGVEDSQENDSSVQDSPKSDNSVQDSAKVDGREIPEDNVKQNGASDAENESKKDNQRLERSEKRDLPNLRNDMKQDDVQIGKVLEQNLNKNRASGADDTLNKKLDSSEKHDALNPRSDTDDVETVKIGDNLNVSDIELVHYFLKFSHSQKYFAVLNISRDICHFVGDLSSFFKKLVDSKSITVDFDVKTMDTMFVKAVERMMQGLKKFGADLYNKRGFVKRFHLPHDNYGFNNIITKAKNKSETFSRMRESFWYFDDYDSFELFVQNDDVILRECSMLDAVDYVGSGHAYEFQTHVKSFVKKLIKKNFMKAEKPYWLTYMLYLSLLECMDVDLHHVVRSVCNHVISMGPRLRATSRKPHSQKFHSKATAKHHKSTSKRAGRSSDKEEESSKNSFEDDAVHFTAKKRRITAANENPTEPLQIQERIAVAPNNEIDQEDNKYESDYRKKKHKSKKGGVERSVSVKKKLARAAAFAPSVRFFGSSGCATFRLKHNTLSLNGLRDEAKTVPGCKKACIKHKCKALDFDKVTKHCSLHLTKTFMKNRMHYRDYTQYVLRCSVASRLCKHWAAFYITLLWTFYISKKYLD